MDKPTLSSDLERCENRESIESVFAGYNIRKIEEKLDIIKNIMGDYETFYSSPIGSIEKEYHREVSIFLTKAWAISEFYKRAGL